MNKTLEQALILVLVSTAIWMVVDTATIVNNYSSKGALRLKQIELLNIQIKQIHQSLSQPNPD